MEGVGNGRHLSRSPTVRTQPPRGLVRVHTSISLRHCPASSALHSAHVVSMISIRGLSSILWPPVLVTPLCPAETVPSLQLDQLTNALKNFIHGVIIFGGNGSTVESTHTKESCIFDISFNIAKSVIRSGDQCHEQ